MKRTGWPLALLLAVLPFAAARGQGPVTALESLEIILWPDYDRPSVLVLLTGTLTASTPLPALVSLPLPSDAQLNAVARIDAERRMVDDIPYSADAGKLTLTTPDPRFRVEYYVPYRVEAGEHSFRFTWLADLSVERLETTVQRPAAAPSLVTEPMAQTVVKGSDGLDYFRMPAQAVPSGQPFTLQVRYPMPEARLSVARPGGTTSAPMAASPAAPAAAPTTAFGWPALIAVVGVGLVSALVTWQLARGGSAAAVPSAAGREEPAEHRRCRSCGRPAAEADRFCSNCGARLDGE